MTHTITNSVERYDLYLIQARISKSIKNKNYSCNIKKRFNLKKFYLIGQNMVL